MSGNEGVTRRDFVAAASGAAAASLVPGSASGALEATPLRDRRHRRARHRHVGAPARRALLGRARVRRPVRREPAEGRGGEAGDRGPLPHVHQPRGDARPGEARAADGDDRRRDARGLHRDGARAGRGRAHREADGGGRAPVPGRARRREAQRAQDRRDVQLPLRAEAPEDQGAAAVGRHRPGHLRGLLLVSRHDARRRLLPPLAPPAREERLALGPQGDAPLRPRQLVARRRPGRGAGLRQPAAATASRVPSTPRTAGRARTRRSATTTGTSRRTRGSWHSTWTARRPTATSATAASSRRTSTSPTR